MRWEQPGRRVPSATTARSSPRGAGGLMAVSTSQVGEPEQTVWRGSVPLPNACLSRGAEASEQLLRCFVNKWGTHFFNLESCG